MPRKARTENSKTTTKPTRAAAKATPAPKRGAKTASRTRRSPYDLVQALRVERDQIAESYGARIAKLDQRIAELEARHADRIRIAELLESKTAEEIERDELAVRQQLALLKKARKAAGSSR